MEQETKDYNPGSIGTIFSVVQKEYETEENRSKALETKAQVLLVVSGVLSSASMSLLKLITDQEKLNVIDYSLMSLTFTCLVAAMVHFLLVFQIQSFKKIDHDVLVSDKAIFLEDNDFKFHLAHDYHDATVENIRVGDIKKERVQAGSNFLLLSIAAFSLTLIVSTVDILLRKGY